MTINLKVKFLIVFGVSCFLLMAFGATGYGQDKVWVKFQKKQSYIDHVVTSGETIFMLAERYNAPSALTARNNGKGFQDGLAEGSRFKIPLGNYNYLSINSVVKSVPIYHKVEAGEDLRTISRALNVSQSAIQRWNNLSAPEVATGDVIQVGWVKYDRSKIPFSDSKKEKAQDKKEGPTPLLTNKDTLNVKRKKDSLFSKTDSLKHLEEEAPKKINTLKSAFQSINRHRDLTETSGSGVFFPINYEPPEGVYYVFFDDAPRGTILSIYNPTNRTVIYAKVIGPLPNLARYQHAKLGISDNALPVLKPRSQRIFCKIKY